MSESLSHLAESLKSLDKSVDGLIAQKQLWKSIANNTIAELRSMCDGDGFVSRERLRSICDDIEATIFDGQSDDTTETE